MAKYFKHNQLGETSYDAVKEEPSETVESVWGPTTIHKNARVVVTPPREMSLYGKDRWGDDIFAEDRIRETMYNQHPDDIEEEVERQRDTPQMFRHTPAEVFSAFSDPSMRVHMGTLLGMAINDNKGKLQAPYSLSKHSSRLVQRGVASGVVSAHPENPYGDETNDYDFDEQKTGMREGRLVEFGLGNEVSKAEVSAARSTIHGLMGRSKLSPQFKALQKFEQDRDTPYNPSNDPSAMKFPGM